jgi:hypothetical protein
MAIPLNGIVNNVQPQAAAQIAPPQASATNNVRDLARVANANAAQLARGVNQPQRGVGAVLAGVAGGPPRGQKRNKP